jgi:hypothetical protein
VGNYLFLNCAGAILSISFKSDVLSSVATVFTIKYSEDGLMLLQVRITINLFVSM